MPRPLAKLYLEGFDHCRQRVQGEIEYAMHRLDREDKRALVAERRANAQRREALRTLQALLVGLQPRAEDREG